MARSFPFVRSIEDSWSFVGWLNKIFLLSRVVLHVYIYIVYTSSNYLHSILQDRLAGPYNRMRGTSVVRGLRSSLPRCGSANFIRHITTQGSPPSPPSSDTTNSRTASFGFRTVAEEEKESLVKNVFNSVAPSYDLMNDASSLGVHRLWKDTFVLSLQPGRKGPKRCLDVAGGTGDIAHRILDHARERYADRETTVEVVDINNEMLREGVQRFKRTMYHNSEHHILVLD